MVNSYNFSLSSSGVEQVASLCYSCLALLSLNFLHSQCKACKYNYNCSVLFPLLSLGTLFLTSTQWNTPGAACVQHEPFNQNIYLVLTALILVNDQLDAQFFFRICLFQFPTCFKHPCAHHQEN